ncbi:hypothetical protein ACFFON_06400 [Arthrobacter citreus]|uniref:hypothetical protein n=1 Tax=Arthrobacter TaxID=1663 RepID=UPI001264CB6C|nr:hypothetical protein [Arthrobacter gandavensis]
MNTRRIFFWLALVLLILGVTLGGLFVVLELDGFFGGMCAGAGVMFLVLAAYVFGRFIWFERGRGQASGTEWLPSRDRNDWLPSRDQENRS